MTKKEKQQAIKKIATYYRECSSFERWNNLSRMCSEILSTINFNVNSFEKNCQENYGQCTWLEKVPEDMKEEFFEMKEFQKSVIELMNFSTSVLKKHSKPSEKPSFCELNIFFN